MTEAGMILGTASYMAPEQARGKATDKRADIFAFGVVLHELITGKRLFGGEDAGEMLAKVIRDEPDLSDAPSSVQRLLSECLQKDPRKRLRDIGDVWRLLDGVSAPGDTAQAASAIEARKSGREKWLWPGVAAVLLVSTAALAFLHFREKAAVLAPMRFEIFPPPKTTLDTFALSPDGRKLIFEARGGDGRSGLWIRLMDSLQARELPGTEGATPDPAWSPDSQYVAFASAGTLKKIDIAGGPPQTLAPIVYPAAGISWSQQDVILYGSKGVINRVAASGGETSAVTVLNSKRGEVAQILPFFLPDGKHFLYYEVVSTKDDSGVFVGSLDAKPAEQGQKRLVASPAGAKFVASSSEGAGRGSGFLFFLRGDALMTQPFDPGRLELTGRAVQLADRVSANTFGGLFSVSNNGLLGYAATGGDKRQLTWYDREGKILGHAGEPIGRDELELSPDGVRVAEGRVDDRGTWGVWMLDLARGANTRLSFEAGGGSAVWLPDGSQIVYAPAGGQSTDLYRKPANGAGQGEVILHSEGIKTPDDWSHDGRFVIYMQRSKNASTDLWVLPLQGDRKPMPYLTTQFNETQAKFSPDGHWVVYASNESGTREVYVQPFPTSSGGKWAVSNGGGSQPRWSRDGKELFYFAPDSTLMEVSVTTTGGGFQPGAPKPLFRATVLGGLGGGAGVAWRWDISPDGKRFLINTALDESTAAPVTVVLNWQSAVK
jgi:Tol biopolymer transport system component